MFGLSRVDEHGDMDMNSNPLLYRRKDLAAALQVSVCTIDNMRSSELLPEPIQISPRLIGWPAAVIEHWLMNAWIEQYPDYNNKEVRHD